MSGALQDWDVAVKEPAVEHLLPQGMFAGPTCRNISGSCKVQHQITEHACPLAQDLLHFLMQLQLTYYHPHAMRTSKRLSVCLFH